MKKFISQIEIAFWDTAITLMSQEKTPRVYTHTLAAMTLCLRPEFPRTSWHHLMIKRDITSRQWIRLGIIALTGLILGVILGLTISWLESS